MAETQVAAVAWREVDVAEIAPEALGKMLQRTSGAARIVAADCLIKAPVVLVKLKVACNRDRARPSEAIGYAVCVDTDVLAIIP